MTDKSKSVDDKRERNVTFREPGNTVWDTGYCDTDASVLSPSSVQGQAESQKGDSQDQFTKLLESLERMEKKFEKKFESMERTIQQFQLTNIEAQVAYEIRIDKKIEEQKTAHNIRVDYFKTEVQNLSTKVDVNLAEYQHRIITTEKGLREETKERHERLKNKIQDNDRANKEKFDELEHRHESLKVGIDGEIKKLKNRQVSLAHNSGDSARLIHKQIKLPVYNGKNWEKPINFLREVEEYFNLVGADDDISLRLIGQSLNYDAKDWWIARRDTISSWDEFKSKFLSRFWGDEIQRDIKRDIEYGFYKEESKITWSEYAGRKFATAIGLNPPMLEEEIVRNLIRHFDDPIVEAARCRNIKEMDSFLSFLDEMQTGGRSNTPKSRGSIAYRKNQINNQVLDEKPKQVSWRANNNAVSMDKPNPLIEANLGDSRRRPEQNQNISNRSSNWTSARISAISEEDQLEGESENNIEINQEN